MPLHGAGDGICVVLKLKNTRERLIVQENMRKTQLISPDHGNPEARNKLICFLCYYLQGHGHCKAEYSQCQGHCKAV